MNNFLIFTITGLVNAGIYATSACGLVVTYITSRVFNFAHGAIGMLVAFLYYTLRVTLHWNEWLSLAVCLLVIAPALGVLLDVALMRRLQRVPVAVRLMVTLALFLLLTGLATVIWGSSLRSLPTLLGSGTFTPVSGINVTYDQLAIVLVAVAVVVGLGLFLGRTRTGATMRAVVDDRTLSEMHGVRVSAITSLSWAIGSSLAALAAILIAPSLTLSVEALSILVVSSYAAAVVGRLSSLPLTLLGSLVLGLLSSYIVGYLPANNQLVAQLGPAMPFIVLFIALIVLRSEPGARFERVEIAPEPRAPSLRRSLLIGALIVAGVSAISPVLSTFGTLVLALGLVYAAVLLSLVVITGMSGQISLAQLSFAGMSAVLLGHLASHMPWVLAALLASLAAAATGAVVAIPALRLRGLYLALYTLAFAVMMDNVFFPDSHLISPNTGALTIPPPSLDGHALTTNRSQLWLLAVLVAVFLIVIYAIRRRPYGHALAALRDAPVAASTLGLNLTKVKVIVFATSAGMAGLAGCFYGVVIGEVTGGVFNYQTSLSALLILAIYGLGSVPGAIVGAVFYVVTYQLLPTWIHSSTWVEGLQPVLIAGGVLNLVIHPEGVIAQNRNQFRARRRKAVNTAVPEHLDLTADLTKTSGMV